MLIRLRFCVHYSFSDFKLVVSVLSFLISDSFQCSGQIYCASVNMVFTVMFSSFPF